MNKRRKLWLDRVSKAISAVGIFAIIAAAGTGLLHNSGWMSARREVVPTQVHITNFEESLDEVSDEDTYSIMKTYHLVGTYDNKSGETSVIVLDEAYTDKSFASEQIGEDRNVYLPKDTFGAAGIKEVSVPDFDKGFIPVLISGTVIAMLGAASFVVSKKQQTASPA